MGGLVSLGRSFTTLSVACLISEEASLLQRKEKGIESELSLSQTVALFLAISVGCRCFGKRLSPVFGTIPLIASTLGRPYLMREFPLGVNLMFLFFSILFQQLTDAGWCYTTVCSLHS